MKRTRTIVAFSGGGTNGAHHGGVLEALIEKKGVTVDAVVGVSTGALAAGYLAQAGFHWPAQCYRVQQFKAIWFQLQTPNDVRSGNWLTAAWRAITGKPSLYTLAPLQKRLTKHVVRPPQIPCELGVVSLDTGRYEGLRPNTALALRDAMLASASVPVVAPPINDRVDGGVVHVSPLGPAFDLARRLGWMHDEVRILLSNCWARPTPENYERPDPGNWGKRNVLRVGKRALDIQGGYQISLDIAHAKLINEVCREYDMLAVGRPISLADKIVADVVEVAGDWGYDTWHVNHADIVRRWNRGRELAMAALDVIGWE